jgi:hypothetical protein
MGARNSMMLTGDNRVLAWAVGFRSGAAALFRRNQRVAQGHFIIRRLERIYGRPVVQRQYEQLSLR